MPIRPLSPICTTGDPLLSKNPDGYVRVMVLPAIRAPPAVVVNVKVQAMELLPAKRSACAMKKETLVT